jgi:hypothetical protein
LFVLCTEHMFHKWEHMCFNKMRQQKSKKLLFSHTNELAKASTCLWELGWRPFCQRRSRDSRAGCRQLSCHRPSIPLPTVASNTVKYSSWSYYLIQRKVLKLYMWNSAKSVLLLLFFFRYNTVIQ